VSQLRQQNPLDVSKILQRLRDNRLVHVDIELDNFVLTISSVLYLIDLLSCTLSLQKAFDCNLTHHPLLKPKAPSAGFFRIAALFFSASEIEATLGLIDTACVQLDVLTEQDICKQIRQASESF
jgi:serine/threonine protein kinase